MGTAIAIGVVVLVAFFALNWWVKRMSRDRKDSERELHQIATDHAGKLAEEAARVRKVASAKPVGSDVVESVRERVRKKRGE